MENFKGQGRLEEKKKKERKKERKKEKSLGTAGIRGEQPGFDSQQGRFYLFPTTPKLTMGSSQTPMRCAL
jgi:hypothetical protein